MDKFAQFSLHRGSLAPMEMQLDVRDQRATAIYFVRRLGENESAEEDITGHAD
jgi:hypothetical protein